MHSVNSTVCEITYLLSSVNIYTCWRWKSLSLSWTRVARSPSFLLQYVPRVSFCFQLVSVVCIGSLSFSYPRILPLRCCRGAVHFPNKSSSWPDTGSGNVSVFPSVVSLYLYNCTKKSQKCKYTAKITQGHVLKVPALDAVLVFPNHLDIKTWRKWWSTNNQCCKSKTQTLVSAAEWTWV